MIVGDEDSSHVYSLADPGVRSCGPDMFRPTARLRPPAPRCSDAPRRACPSDSTLSVRSCRPYLNQLVALETGSVTLKRVLTPGVLARSIRPSWASTIFRT